MDPEELPPDFVSSYAARLATASGGRLLPALASCRRGCVIVMLDLLDVDPRQAPGAQRRRQGAAQQPLDPSNPNDGDDPTQHPGTGTPGGVAAHLPLPLEAVLAAMPVQPPLGARVTVYMHDGGGQAHPDGRNGGTHGGANRAGVAGAGDGTPNGDSGSWTAGGPVMLEWAGPVGGWRALREQPAQGLQPPRLQMEVQLRSPEPADAAEGPSAPAAGVAPAPLSHAVFPPADSDHVSWQGAARAAADPTMGSTTVHEQHPQDDSGGPQLPDHPPGRVPPVPPLSLAAEATMSSSGAPGPCDAHYSVSAYGEADPRSTSDARSVSFGAVYALGAGSAASQARITPVWRLQSGGVFSGGPSSRQDSWGPGRPLQEALRWGQASNSSQDAAPGQARANAASGTDVGSGGCAVTDGVPPAGTDSLQQASGEGGQGRSSDVQRRASGPLSALTRRLVRRTVSRMGQDAASGAVDGSGNGDRSRSSCDNGDGACAAGRSGPMPHCPAQQQLPPQSRTREDEPARSSAAPAAPAAQAPTGELPSGRPADTADGPMQKLMRRLRQRLQDPAPTAPMAVGPEAAVTAFSPSALSHDRSQQQAHGQHSNGLSQQERADEGSAPASPPQPVAAPAPAAQSLRGARPSGAAAAARSSARATRAVGNAAMVAAKPETLEDALRSLVEEYGTGQVLSSVDVQVVDVEMQSGFATATMESLTAPADLRAGRMLSRQSGKPAAPSGGGGGWAGGGAEAGLLLTSDGAGSLLQSFALMSISQPSSPRRRRADGPGSGIVNAPGTRGLHDPRMYVSSSNLLRRMWLQGKSPLGGAPRSSMAELSSTVPGFDALWSGCMRTAGGFSGWADGDGRGAGPRSDALRTSDKELWAFGPSGTAFDGAAWAWGEGPGFENWPALNSSLLRRMPSLTIKQAAEEAAAALAAAEAEAAAALAKREGPVAASVATAGLGFEAGLGAPSLADLLLSSADGFTARKGRPLGHSAWPALAPAGTEPFGAMFATGAARPRAEADAVLREVVAAAGAAASCSGPHGLQGSGAYSGVPFGSAFTPPRSIPSETLFPANDDSAQPLDGHAPRPSAAAAAAAVAGAPDVTAAVALEATGPAAPTVYWEAHDPQPTAAMAPTVEPVALVPPTSTAASVRLALRGLPAAWASAVAVPEQPSVGPGLQARCSFGAGACAGVGQVERSATSAAAAAAQTAGSAAASAAAGISVASWGSELSLAQGSGGVGGGSIRALKPPLALAAEPKHAPVTDFFGAAALSAPLPAAGSGLEVAVRSSGRYLPVSWWWRPDVQAHAAVSDGGGVAGVGDVGCSAGEPVLELSVTGVLGQGLLVVEVWYSGAYHAALPVVCSHDAELVEELTAPPPSVPPAAAPPLPPTPPLPPRGALPPAPVASGLPESVAPGALPVEVHSTVVADAPPASPSAAAGTAGPAPAGRWGGTVPDDVLYDLGTWLQYTAGVVPLPAVAAERMLPSLSSAFAQPQPLSPTVSGAAAAFAASAPASLPQPLAVLQEDGTAEQQPQQQQLQRRPFLLQDLASERAAMPDGDVEVLRMTPVAGPLLRESLSAPPAESPRSHIAATRAEPPPRQPRLQQVDQQPADLVSLPQTLRLSAAAGASAHTDATSAPVVVGSSLTPRPEPPASAGQLTRPGSGQLLPSPRPLDTPPQAWTHARRMSLYSVAVDRTNARARICSASGTGPHGGVMRASSTATGPSPPQPYTESGELPGSSSAGALDMALFSSLALASANGRSAPLSAFSAAAASFIAIADVPATGIETDATGASAMLPLPFDSSVANMTAASSPSAAVAGAAATHGSFAPGAGGGGAPPPSRRRAFHDSAVDITVPILPGSLDLASTVMAMQRGPAFGQRMQDLAVGLLAWLVSAGRPVAAGTVLRGLLRQRGMRFEQVCAEVRRAAGTDGAAGATGARSTDSIWGWAGMGLLHLAVQSGCAGMVEAVADWAKTHGSVLDWTELCSAGLTPLHLAASLPAPTLDDGAEDAAIAIGSGGGGVEGNHVGGRAAVAAGGVPEGHGLDEAGLAALAWLLCRFPEARSAWCTLTDAFGTTPAQVLAFHLTQMPAECADRVRSALLPLLGPEGMSPPSPSAVVAAAEAPAAAARLRAERITVRPDATGPGLWLGSVGEGGALRPLRALREWLCDQLEAWAAEPVGALLVLFSVLALIWLLRSGPVYVGGAQAGPGESVPAHG